MISIIIKSILMLLTLVIIGICYGLIETTATLLHDKYLQWKRDKRNW